jgi:signal transduction histidine kinase
MLNARRHGGATAVRLEVADVDGALHLAVTDDGTGLPPEPDPGVGLRSMHERAGELGGWCSVGPALGGGVRVSVGLPLPVGTAP